MRELHTKGPCSGGDQAALTFGMISSTNWLRSSRVFETETPENGGQINGIVMPAWIEMSRKSRF